MANLMDMDYGEPIGNADVMVCDKLICSFQLVPP